MSSRPRDQLTGRHWCAQWMPAERIARRIRLWQRNAHTGELEPIFEDARYCDRLASYGREYCWQHPRKVME